jgi:excinuclease ABC subunit A
MRSTIEVKGARENNLQNVHIEIPRDKLVVVTGVSGSGKSSLAFDTVYAEGQRRFMESLSTFARRFVSQLKKPDVDFVNGLSPVISIEQKTVMKNPRSTVGTMTDLYDYLRMLFATIGLPRCPITEENVKIWTPHQIAEHMLALPEGTEIEVRAPVLKIYGEDYPYLFDDIRTKGYRRLRINNKVYDLSEEFELDEDKDHTIEVIIDRFVIRKGLDKQIVTSLTHGLEIIGEGFLSFHALTTKNKKAIATFHKKLGGSSKNVVAGRMHHGMFTFNDPAGACVTCSGLGTYLKAHPDLVAPDKDRSIKDGALVKEALKYDVNTWGGRILFSLANKYKFDLDKPYKDLSDKIKDLLLYGTQGEKVTIEQPPGAKAGAKYIGREFRFDGVINQIERRYRRYRQKGTAHGGMEDYLRKVMVENPCPDCAGQRLKQQRLLVTVKDHNIYAFGQMHFQELFDFLTKLKVPARQKEVAEQIIYEITSRLELLIGIGLDYLNLNRPSATLSGGESQRIRLSTQIGSGLMGMLYVLDEPSIGLHPKDNVKMIHTMRRLRDIGNTVIVVEHDEDTIRAADHIIEMGPGPGVHGGHVVTAGPIKEVMKCKESPTAQFLSGRKKIHMPKQRRQTNGKTIRITGARENNLKNIDVEIPLGVLTCLTGASGSGKSTLIHEILYKKLYNLYHDSRVMSGEHDDLTGHEHLGDIINIDQSPIGRSPRSNPATYIGFYDNIRKIFAATDEAKEREYTVSRFSFNVKGGRCEECSGEGSIKTSLAFMPDVEVPCPTCKGARYNDETLEVTYNGKTIADVLDMSIEDGVEFFTNENLINHKLSVLNSLGLGYLKIGHPAPILSGGEAQRVKLANELSKIKRGKHNLYILDEPTTGLHLADIQKLLDALNGLVDAGHTVVVIEHQLDIIKTADHVIDLGPEGGHRGGEVIASGTPEVITKTKKSYTGQFLKPYLNKK